MVLCSMKCSKHVFSLNCADAPAVFFLWSLRGAVCIHRLPHTKPRECFYSQGTPGEGPHLRTVAEWKACDAERRTGGKQTLSLGVTVGCFHNQHKPEQIQNVMEVLLQWKGSSSPDPRLNQLRPDSKSGVLLIAVVELFHASFIRYYSV